MVISRGVDFDSTRHGAYTARLFPNSFPCKTFEARNGVDYCTLSVFERRETMMVDKEIAEASGILQLISTLSTQGMSGRLDVVAGASDGAIFFKDGKLMDARIGHLTGFQAMNALASMRDAHYQFDPTATIPTSSSITSSERLVLKQFFGIATADPESTPAMIDQFDETTVVTSNVPDAPIEPVAPYQIRSTGNFTPYLIAVAVGVLAALLAGAAVLLRSKFRERTVPASVATSTEATDPISGPVPTEPTVDQPPATAATESKTTTARDLSGRWNVVNTVHTTTNRGFQNLQVGFALSISQTGRTFTANGQKVSENGRSLPAGSRTPIQLKGFIDGDRVEATFSEQGALRKTNGRFVWKLDRAGGGLSGSFASTAAQSSGRSTARREL